MRQLLHELTGAKAPGLSVQNALSTVRVLVALELRAIPCVGALCFNLLVATTLRDAQHSCTITLSIVSFLCCQGHRVCR